MTRREINRQFWMAMNAQNEFNVASVTGQAEYLALEHRCFGSFTAPIYQCDGSTLLTLQQMLNDATSDRIRIRQSMPEHFWTYGRCRSLMRDRAITWRQTNGNTAGIVIFEDDADDDLRPVVFGRIEF